jgi:diadenosine tetraphosphatase ApaH/serine/threonine PP2A family protein phosphatase
LDKISMFFLSSSFIFQIYMLLNKISNKHHPAGGLFFCGHVRWSFSIYWMAGVVLDFIYSGFEAALATEPSAVESIGIDKALPEFSESTLLRLCSIAAAHFQSQPNIFRINSPITIVGDIHGSLHDLFRIILLAGPSGRFLFLGDYVDRGQFSIECIVLLFVLTCKFPDRFFLLRGNHECIEVCSDYGFKADILTLYSEEVFNAFCDSFAWLPLAAVVNSSLFCVHGGIGPGVFRLEQIEQIQRPVLSVRDVPILHTILWADPCPGLTQYGESMRGGAPSFGPGPAKEFLRVNNCTLIVRAHECVKNGIEFISQMCLATVFSASSYEAGLPNSSGALLVHEDGTVKKQVLPPLPRMPRIKASFYSLRQTQSDGQGSVAPVRSATLRFSSSQLDLMMGPGLAKSPSMLGMAKSGSRMLGRGMQRSRVKTVYAEAHSSFGDLPPGSEEV